MAWKEKLGKKILTDEETYDFEVHIISGKFSPNECKGMYNKWASSYDREVCNEKEGPPTVAEKADKLIDKNSRNTIKVLDVGAGTGVVGGLLKEKGFTNIDALDPSEGMLSVAKSKNIYTNYICEFLTGEPLDIPADSYDLVASSGAFIAGHVPPEAFMEMHRLVKPGGFIIFAFADDYLEKEAMDTETFYKIMEGYEAKKKWKILSQDHLNCYHKMPHVISGKCYVLKVLN